MVRSMVLRGDHRGQLRLRTRRVTARPGFTLNPESQLAGSKVAVPVRCASGGSLVRKVAPAERGLAGTAYSQDDDVGFGHFKYDAIGSSAASLKIALHIGFGATGEIPQGLGMKLRRLTDSVDRPPEAQVPGNCTLH